MTESKRPASDAPDAPDPKSARTDALDPEPSSDAAKEVALVLGGKVRPSLWKHRGKVFARKRASGNLFVFGDWCGYALMDCSRCPAQSQLQWAEILSENEEEPDEERKNDIDASLERSTGGVTGDYYMLFRIDMERTARTMELPAEGSREYQVLASRVVAMSSHWRNADGSRLFPSQLVVPFRLRFRSETVSETANLWLRNIEYTREGAAPPLTSPLEQPEYPGHEFWVINAHRVDWDRRSTRRQITKGY